MNTKPINVSSRINFDEGFGEPEGILGTPVLIYGITPKDNLWRYLKSLINQKVKILEVEKSVRFLYSTAFSLKEDFLQKNSNTHKGNTEEYYLSLTIKFGVVVFVFNGNCELPGENLESCIEKILHPDRKKTHYIFYVPHSCPFRNQIIEQMSDLYDQGIYDYDAGNTGDVMRKIAELIKLQEKIDLVPHNEE